MNILVKVGGAQLDQPQERAAFARAIGRARDDGHRIVVIHGGGRQIRAFADAMGLAAQTVDGLRVTDARTAEVAAAVLAGLVNQKLVAALNEANVPAAGLAGADGATLQAVPHRPNGKDLGYVGRVERVGTALLTLLGEGGFVPVVATVAPLRHDLDGDHSQLYNINADMAVAPIARALGADAVLFLTDTDGVCDAAGTLRATLTARDCKELETSGALRGGMAPKVRAARDARAIFGLRLVKIAAAAGDDAVRSALDSDRGTTFLEEACGG